MVVYIILMIIALLLLLIRNTMFYTDNILRNIIFLFITILLFIVYVFRSINVGSDYELYNAFFYYSTNALKSFHIEPAYIYINSIAQNYNNFLILTSIIFLISFVGIYQLSKELNVNTFSFLSFFILTYVYYNLFNIMRQFSALGIVCLGLCIFLKLYTHKYIKYIIYILIIYFANLFHNTAIACLLLVLLFIFHLNKKIMTLFLISIPFLFYSRILNYITYIILTIFPRYVLKYSNNISSITTTLYNSNIQLIVLIIETIFLVLYLYNVNPKLLKKHKINFILNGYFLYLLLATGGNILIGRIQTYFYIFPLLFACIFVDTLNNKYIVLKVSYILFLIIYYFIQLININNGGIVPYSFI